MKKLYDYYIRFLVWLGAEPPPGYEYLLSDELNKDMISADQGKIENSPIVGDDHEGFVTEEDLPDWLKG